MSENKLQVARDKAAEMYQHKHRMFAGQIKAGCWDHRSEVQDALNDPEKFEARKNAWLEKNPA